MRISSGAVLAALIVGAVVTGAAAAGGVKYTSPQAAFEQGLGAYRSGYYEIAIPALEEAATKGDGLSQFFAEFYLARIYSDKAGGQIDDAKAYLLFQKLADENADTDPDDGRRAPFVAKSLTALARYLKQGVKDINVKPDHERAVAYLRHAATFFNDKDAQFELAKVYLSGGGSPEDVKRGMHYLSVLTEEGHPGAQALLADLLWNGRYVKKDERRALALITVSVENAPAHERLWIEDIYQNIFCGTSQGTRKQASGIIPVWRKVFAPQSQRPEADQMGLGLRELQPQRKCENGEVLDIHRAGEQSAAVSPSAGRPPEAMQGGAAGFGLRDVGVTKR